ncbi:MAG: hypothetical protein Q7R97_03275 [Candidatus Daviesbacteria bacterium]|nr:hypothetical protein [Candidatus Daviesbacteria bacterium]
MQALEQQLLIPQDRITAPLVEFLEEVAPKPINQPQSKKPTNALKESLDNLFPEQQYVEKNIQKSKEILGELAGEFTQEQFKDVITEVQFLAESWLDNFEREIFGGLTLQELLHEKGKL